MSSSPDEHKLSVSDDESTSPQPAALVCGGESRKIWRPMDPDSSTLPTSVTSQLRHSTPPAPIPADVFQQFSWNCFLKSKWESFASANYNQQYQQFQRQSLSLLRKKAEIESNKTIPTAAVASVPCTTLPTDCSCTSATSPLSDDKRKSDSGKNKIEV